MMGRRPQRSSIEGTPRPADGRDSLICLLTEKPHMLGGHW